MACLFDPARPVTWGYYDTYTWPHESRGENNVNTGAWGVDVRNSDGLIVVSDMVTGLWVFRMEGFDGWTGNDWGMPNLSSAQDWEHGPVAQAVRLRGTPSHPGNLFPPCTEQPRRVRFLPLRGSPTGLLLRTRDARKRSLPGSLGPRGSEVTSCRFPDPLCGWPCCSASL